MGSSSSICMLSRYIPGLTNVTCIEVTLLRWTQTNPPDTQQLVISSSPAFAKFAAAGIATRRHVPITLLALVVRYPCVTSRSVTRHTPTAVPPAELSRSRTCALAVRLRRGDWPSGGPYGWDLPLQGGGRVLAGLATEDARSATTTRNFKSV